MGEKDAKKWRKFCELYPANPAQNERGLTLYKEVVERGRLSVSPSEFCNLDRAILFNFYRRVALLTTPGRPFFRKQSVKWLLERDLVFINLRQMGGWLGLLRAAPLLMGSALCLSPFTLTEADDDGLALSHTILDPSLADKELLNHGITLEEQMEFALEALRRLSLGVGFTLNSTVSKKATVVQKMPELFTEFTADRRSLHPAMTKLALPFSSGEGSVAFDYLTNVVKYMWQTYGFDFVFYNFTKFEALLGREIAADFYEKSRVNDAFGVVYAGINLPADIDVGATKTFSLDTALGGSRHQRFAVPMDRTRRFFQTLLSGYFNITTRAYKPSFSTDLPLILPGEKYRDFLSKDYSIRKNPIGIWLMWHEKKGRALALFLALIDSDNVHFNPVEEGILLPGAHYELSKWMIHAELAGFEESLIVTGADWHTGPLLGGDVVIFLAS